MGPLWLDLTSYELDAEERELLMHPGIGGVILFARNFYDNRQLKALTKDIRQAARSEIIIGVDQEGGRVQRFKQGFTQIPPAQDYALMQDGEAQSMRYGYIMATELIEHSIDISFAPVLDCGFACPAIGSRAFGSDAASVLRYSRAFLQGMRRAKMATTGKHFPGHGQVTLDSHLATPIDSRVDLGADFAIFKTLIAENALDAIMPAHVIYSHFAEQPASGSKYWLKDILRTQLGFKGIVFSDDLNMEGAAIMGSAAVRAQQSLDAGCDMLLMCNNRAGTIDILDNTHLAPFAKAISLRAKV